VILRRKAVRTAALPSSPPDPEQVEALVDVFDAVSRQSEYGGTFPELATAALVWMRDKQQQGARL
jgi:hypothetical protein